MRTAVMALGLVSALLASGVLACGREAPQANSEGNDAFDAQDYAGAIEAYERAQEGNPELPQPFYNTGNAQYRQGSYDEALSSYNDALLNADEELTGSIHFNRGNVHYDSEAYGEAVEAYKEVLRLDPDDEDAKRNLELALRHIQQQEQRQPGQEHGDQGQQEEGETQQRGGQQEEDEEQESQGDQQEEQEQEGDEQQQPDAGQEGEEQPQDQQQQPQPGLGGEQSPPLTPEQARQLLEAVASDSETLQEHLQGEIVQSGPPSGPDW